MDFTPNLQNLMKEAQKMQDRLKQAQEDLSRVEVEGEAGGKLVCVRMNGKHEVLKTRIDPSLLDEDISMIEDLVTSAYNSATRKVEDVSKKAISQLTAGMNIPPDFLKKEED